MTPLTASASPADDTPPLIHVQAVSKHHALGKVEVKALTDVELRIPAGVMTIISGPSGSGKSTLLQLMGGLDVPTTGRIHIHGQDLTPLNDKARSDFRARTLGFVFQSFNLLPVLSALENVALPLLLRGHRRAQAWPRAQAMLNKVGLAERAQHRPSELSGGQQQRVAIARALVHEPRLVLADEPTANLDQHTGRAVVALMRQLQREAGTTFVLSSHDPTLSALAECTVTLVDGRVVSTTRKNHHEPA